MDPEAKTYRKLNVEERTYLVCNMNLVEDEIHFLYHFPIYNEQTKLLFTEVTQVYNNFLNMFNEEQLSLIFNQFEKPLFVYLYDSWNICKKKNKLSINKELNKARKNLTFSK